MATQSMSSIINLTQHSATPEQVAAGVIEPANKAEVQSVLTFRGAPSATEISDRAAKLAEVAQQSGCSAAMIAGAPYLMGALERALCKVGVKPLYSFSTRESVETQQPDGSVVKTNVFRHAGWVEVPMD